jgi:hypothetical protein
MQTTPTTTLTTTSDASDVSAWTWQGQTDFDTAAWFGFVYVITDPDNRHYIGRKYLHKMIRRKAGKLKVSTDWPTYWSSSPDIQRRTAIDTSGWRRRIVALAPTRGTVNYAEAWLQIKLNVLTQPNFLNGIVSVRIGRPAVRRWADVRWDQEVINELCC